MRWELIPYQHNPMSLVRVKDGWKRQREPKALSVTDFRKVLENTSEPFRTMCIVAMCLGLRVSKVLGLKGRIRPDRLAYVQAQPFNAASCARRRSQGATGTLATCGYSNDYEYLHACGSNSIARSE